MELGEKKKDPEDNFERLKKDKTSNESWRFSYFMQQFGNKIG